MPRYDAAPTVAAGLLRLARHKAELTQRELAERAGVTQQAISAYETGRMEPTLPTLQRLLAAAGFEMRMGLEPLSDDAYQQWLEALPDETRVEVDRASRQRAADARLRRIRGR